MKPTVLANSVAIVWGTAYTLCGLSAAIFPDLYFGVLKSWFHGLNLEVTRSTSAFSLGSFIMGVFTFTAYIWFITFVTASIYNRWSPRRGYR